MDRLPTRRTIAVLIALISTLAGVAVAQASSGGVSPGGSGGGGGGSEVTPVTPGCPNTQLGRRTLRLGDCGGDVATLNWILKAKDYGDPALVDEFEDATEGAVEEFQRDADLGATGSSIPRPRPRWSTRCPRSSPPGTGPASSATRRPAGRR